MAIACPWIETVHSAAASSAIAAILEAVRVFTDARHDQARTVDAFDDCDDVQGENGHPGEGQDETEDAAEAERRHADEARHGDVEEQQDELGHREHDSVPRM